MAMKRSSAEETQREPEVASGGSTKTIRLTAAEQRALERRAKGAVVRKKYDFTVIRKLRHEKSLTIEQFAKVCGLSYAPVSRIETNLIKPNLDTLDKIADGLGITTHHLIALAEKRDVEQDRAREVKSGTMTFSATGGDGLDVLTCTAKKGAVSGDFSYRSQDAATVTVTAGRLQVVVNDKTKELGAADVLRFDASSVHRFSALEDGAFVVVVHAPR
jgi:transcriptional regulator with XRE-family HTH domain